LHPLAGMSELSNQAYVAENSQVCKFYFEPWRNNVRIFSTAI